MQAVVEAAHANAFCEITNFIYEHVIENNDVVPVSTMRLVYIEHLDISDFPNKDYCSEKLMKHLKNHPDIGPKWCFTKVDGTSKGWIAFCLVYSSSITVADIEKLGQFWWKNISASCVILRGLWPGKLLAFLGVSAYQTSQTESNIFRLV